MLKRQSKMLSIALVFVFCMSFLAPGLITPQVAEAAAVEYSAIGMPTVKTSTEFDKNLAQILIEIDDPIYLGSGVNWVTMKMPAGVKVESDSVSEDSVTDNVYSGNIVVYKNSSTVDLRIEAKTQDGKKAKIVLNLEKVKVQSGSGNLDVTFLPQSGSALPGGSVTVANIVSKGATKSLVTSVKDLGDGVAPIDTISIAELSAKTLKKGTIELELPKGVEWQKVSNSYGATNFVAVAGSWAFTGENNYSTTAAFEIKNHDSKSRVLQLEILKDFDFGTAGRIDIGGSGCFLKINIDEDDAKMGDIKVSVSSKDIDGLTEEDIVVAKYADYDASIEGKEVTEIIAGHTDQEIGSFYIEETIAGSLVSGRTLTLALPSGVKWVKKPTFTSEKGDNAVDENDITLTDSKLKATIKATTDGAAKILVEDGEVYVEPNFEGDVEIEITGSAGAKGKIKVAEAIKAIDISASEVPQIIIGEQGQTVGDIIIKENVKEAIQEGDIIIEMDGGYKFYKEPTVKVTEGDLEIDDVDINNDDQLVITIDKDSSEPSTIVISNIYLTGYRYAPAGPVVAKLVEAEGEEDNATITGTPAKVSGSTALDSFYVDPAKVDSKFAKYSEKSAGKVTIANCITPAEAAGISAVFNINSNIYTVNGATKVMDVAPYIKGDRTYVPVRYLAYALGVAEADVVWDEATRKVTLTKGDDVVEMTIGSTTITVNGEAQTMDVAPEINNGRTMLPARYVAEGFGYIVGWDPATRTVIITE
jgi:hypothetical protein